MAIIVTKNAKAAINNNFTEELGLCRQTTIKIHNNGTVSSNGVLNLGRVGDQMATVINIDTTDLVWNSLSGVYLYDAYQPLLVFQNTNGGENISIEFEGNYFSVPESITSTATTYNIIYILKERTEEEEEYEGNVGPEDDSTYQEVFVSQPFSGVVHDSLKSFIAEPILLSNNLVMAENIALQKPQINIDWNGKTGLTISQSVLGEKFDRLITPLVVTNFPNNRSYPNGTYEIFFIKDNIQYKYQTTSAPLKLWIPAEITSVVGTWNIGVHYVNSVDSPSVEAYSNLIVATVQDNFLIQEDLTLDETQSLWVDLVEQTGEVLQVQAGEDEDGNPIYQNAMTYELTGTSYQLQYSGSVVNDSIGWIVNNQSQIETHIQDEVIHITQSDRDSWNAATTKIGSINIDDYVKTEDLSTYATKEDLNDYLKEADLSDYATKDDLSNYATKDNLSDYATKGDLSTLSNIIGNDESGLIQDVNKLHKEVYGNGNETSRIDQLAELTTQHSGSINNLDTRTTNLMNTVYGSDGKTGLSSVVAQTTETINSLNSQLSDKASQTYVDAIDDRVDVLEREVKSIYNNDGEVEAGVLIEKLQDYTTTEELSNTYETKTDAANKQTNLQNQINNIYNTETKTGVLTTEINSAINKYNVQATEKFVDKTTAKNFIENDFVSDIEKVFVAKIVFLNSEEEYDSLETKDPNTLYLIREEQ